MNKAIQEAWALELESGKHEQGFGVLHVVETERKCCLGVLCDMAFRAGVVTRVIDYNIDGRPNVYMYGTTKNGGSLPEEVTDWAELDSGVPEVDGHSLIGWNDILQQSFVSIANLVRKL